MNPVLWLKVLTRFDFLLLNSTHHKNKKLIKPVFKTSINEHEMCLTLPLRSNCNEKIMSIYSDNDEE